MYRQSPSRNQRSKGISVKYFVQYSLLLGVCVWLLYHLKHSHEKNLQHDRSEPESLHVDEIMKLGRKGIQDRFEETAVFEVKIEETTGEEDDSTFEGAGGVKETEKNERGESSDWDEEMTDDEKLREAVDDEKEVEEETDQEEENVPEVREDNYKADDVSSAVTHDSQRRATENENESSEDIEHPETDRNDHDFSEETTKKDTLRDLDGEVNDSENGDELENVNEGSEDNEHGETDIEDRNGHDISEETTKKGTIRDLEGEVNGSENEVRLETENSKSTVTEGAGNLLIGNNSTDLAIGNDNETVKNATESASEHNDETEKLEHEFEDGSDQSGSSNSTVFTETTDTLDETVEEGMDANEVSDTSLIEDNSTSDTNEEDDESERVDRDGTDDDTDILNETMDRGTKRRSQQ